MTHASAHKLVPAALAVLAWAAAGCADDLPLEGRPCPCTGTWQCCEEANVCVRKASECTLALTPSAIRLRIGASHRFSVPLIPVTWSVEEPKGGSVDEQGLYRAPVRPGTYHVRATAKSGAYAVAVVVVGPSQLERLLGTEGGKGTADGIGTDARFSYPASVTGDGEHLYVTDGPVGDFWTDPCLLEVFKADCLSGTHCDAILAKCPPPPAGIRRISLSTLNVSRLAQDRFFRHLAVAQGQLFAATSKPWAGCRCAPISGCPCAVQMPLVLTELVRIDPVTGAVSSLAGVSTRVDPFTSNGWDGWEPPRDGIGDDARLAGVTGLAADGTDTLYVADSILTGTSPSALRRIDIKTGEVATVAATHGWPEVGAPDAPFQSLATLTAHEGKIYGLDAKGGTIWKYDPGTQAFSKHQSWSLKPSLGSPGLCVDRGELVAVTGRCIHPLTSNGDCTPPILSATGSAPKTPTTGIGLPIPNGLWCDGNGTWYAADSMGPTVLKLSADAPESVTVFAGTPAYVGSDTPAPTMSLARPTAIAASATGEVVIYESGATRLVSRQPNGHFAVCTQAAPPMAFGPERFLYDASYDFRRLDLQTHTTLWLAAPPSGQTVRSLVYDGVDKLYASACTTTPEATTIGTILSVDMSGGITPIAKGYCGDLASAGPDRLFLANRGAASNSAEHAESLFSVDVGTGSVSELATPPDGWRISALAYDPAGVLYVAEASRQRVRGLVVDTGEVFDVVGQVGRQGVQLGALPASLNTPSGIALLPDGSLALTDSAENVVLVAQ